MATSYDVIVVGAGSAGVPLAARLAEDPRRRVLLLEAGPRFVGVQALPPELRYGGVLSSMMPGHPNNWGAVATLRPGVQQPNPRGRVVGGSSALNGTLFTRGLPADFDGWAAEGNPEWAYERVLPFFRKLESDQDVRDQWHGAEGPIPVRRASPAEWTPVDRAFVEACRAAGFPDDPDMNAPDSIGVGALPVNTIDGVRMNTALGYLDARPPRPNLTIRAGALARRILLDGRRAVGVEVEADGQGETIHAAEVVVSAGAIRSPQLLMLSGIGPAEELRRLGIDVAHALPQVGRQATDHASVTIPFKLSKRRSPAPDPRRSAWAHAALHFTSTGSAEASDMMLIQSAIPINETVVHGLPWKARLGMLRMTVGSLSLGKLIDYARNGWDQAITCILQRDESRAEVRLASADANDNPELVYHYLQSPADRARLRDGVRLAARLVDGEPYRNLGARRTAPADEVLASDAALDRHIEAHLGTSMHMASTCRMGTSPETSVVDQYCRVHGLDALRVVDSSIMPQVVRRCPAATAIMIGERAAAFFD